ncbi:hypothetical protein TMatcc_009577 [Talaromyces marneffei ATCC 18224]|uniref:Uncharacterized protein n=1 Tax=Talaromyces marneffei (strain ATCC 18224 / CBS 334.59 / QM 7333) TaxID=441960 RepID=B6QSP9_TALMQ|nr:uncharacterized protein EYB26_008822 [Talaromyces marneffei]EEA19444.1 conserved hypothetical protein [Talaromyces marneffei ATCC 18224]KAE8547761.1 hypothetical protein EYB25_009554 [Talaromyces marneffei]QGA21112.1 hypothetical protein EYB26_008822 [Talaromyces marneffei]
MAGDRAEVPYHLDVSGNQYTGNALKQLRLSVERFVPPKTVTVVEDPNLDPFYLERALEAPKQWDGSIDDESEVDLDDLENEYFMSYMTEETQSPPLNQPNPVQSHAIHYQESQDSKPVCPTTPDWQRTHHHHTPSSCSSIQTDATGVTPDLTPSSSFSSTYSDSDYTEGKKPTHQEFLHSHRAFRDRSQNTAQFYLPAATPDNQSRACTRPNTPVERSAVAALAEYHNTSSETLTMVPKEPAVAAASSLRSKPLPSLPPILKNVGPAPLAKKAQNSGSRSQIDPSLISPPSLVNPVTKEPHMTPFNHALFIPAHGCPSPLPNPTPISPLIARQSTNASIKGRPSTSTSVAYGEQSVWESDSESGSISGKSQSRRGPIDTLRKVRSRVQLRRIAKSDAKLHADINNNPNGTTITTTINSIGGTITTTRTTTANAGSHGALWATSPVDAGQTDPISRPDNLTQLDNRAAGSVTSIPDDLLPPPPPLKQTLRLVAPSTTSLPQSSRHSSEKLSGDIDSSTAAAIQAQSRRRQRSNATDEYLPFPKTEAMHHHYYCNSHTLPSSETVSSNTASIEQPTVFKRIWGSLRSLDCRSG